MAKTKALRLCFRICKKPVFSQRGSYLYLFIHTMSGRKIKVIQFKEMVIHFVKVL